MYTMNRRPQSNPDLADYTSTQLLDEIMSRFDASIFCGKSCRGKSVDVFHRRFWGDSLVCSSLAGHMQSVTLDHFSETYEEAEE